MDVPGDLIEEGRISLGCPFEDFQLEGAYLDSVHQGRPGHGGVKVRYLNGGCCEVVEEGPEGLLSFLLDLK